MLFPRHGKKIVAVLCALELAGLVERSPTPTLSEIVTRRGRAGRALGVVLVGALAYHWFGEA